VTVLSYTPQADTLYLQWRHQRIRVGTHDLRIAAICVAHGATLISRNRQDVID
jgi:predicted nucleic acid-binding protein